MSERVEDLERRIANDRRQIDQTLEALEQRLSPGQLVDYAAGYLKSGGAELAGNWGRAVKQNPFPLALTAIGLTWLMRASHHSETGPAWSEARPADPAAFYEGDRKAGSGYPHHPSVLERARRVAHDLKQQVNESAEAFAERVARAQAEILGVGREVGESASDFAQRIGKAIGSGSDSVKESLHHGSQRARELAERGRALADRGREQASAFVHEQPLLALAIGLGFGALLGAILPTTPLERRTVGQLGERARDEVKETAEELGRAAKRVAGDAVEAATEGAEAALHRWEGNGGAARSRH
jgi:ElaB/YqjD/DUF883 family membrane-anchored ribosome-binding protein